MKNVLLDTNILMQDYALNGAYAQTLRASRYRLNFRIYVPQVVIDELDENFKRDIKTLEREWQTLNAKLRRMDLGYTPQALDAEGILERSLPSRSLRRRLGGATILPYPELSIENVVRASYTGKKPFTTSGSGWKDFILWQTIMAFLKNDQDAGLLFVSANRRDFCGEDGELHPDLQSELASYSGNVIVYKSLRELVEKEVAPRLEELTGLKQKIDSGAHEELAVERHLQRWLEDGFRGRDLTAKELELPEALEDPHILFIQEARVTHSWVGRLTQDEVVIRFGVKALLDCLAEVEPWAFDSLSDIDMQRLSVVGQKKSELEVVVLTGVELELTVVYNERTRTITHVSVDTETVPF